MLASVFLVFGSAKLFHAYTCIKRVMHFLQSWRFLQISSFQQKSINTSPKGERLRSQGCLPFSFIQSSSYPWNMLCGSIRYPKNWNGMFSLERPNKKVFFQQPGHYSLTPPCSSLVATFFGGILFKSFKKVNFSFAGSLKNNFFCGFPQTICRHQGGVFFGVQQLYYMFKKS